MPDFPDEIVEAAAKAAMEAEPGQNWECATAKEADVYLRDSLAVLAAVLPLIEQRVIDRLAAQAGTNPYIDGDGIPTWAAWEAWDEGAAAATPDQPTDAYRPWPIAPDTVMPPRRQPIRWGSRADDPPTEIHDDPQRTKAYLAGLAAGRTEAAAASPDERLREALRKIDALVLKWDAPLRHKADDEEAHVCWAAVGSEAHKIARAALAADLIEKGDTDA